MSSYSLDFQILPKEELKDQRLILWIWHADKIPPHLGLSVSNNYFSLKSNGKDMGLPVAKVENILENKPIVTLALDLKANFDVSEIRAIFSEYDKAEAGKDTCLSPINDLFKTKSITIHSFLDYLTESSLINGVYGFNVPPNFEGIPMYSMEDIQNRLKLLESK